MAASESKAPKNAFVAGLVWWTTLVMAVIAVPLIGGIIALAATKSAFAQMGIFMITCWGSVWLGMVLMKQSHHHHFGWHHKNGKKS